MALSALPAAHVGLTARALLRPGATLTLRAVFRSAAHAVTPAGELLVLTGDEVAAPWVLGVPGLPWADLARDAEARVVVCVDSPARLCVASHGVGLGPARVWAAPRPGPPAPPDAVCAALRAAALPPEAPGLAGHGAEPLLERLRAALALDDPVAVAAACAPLVGLGRGLTPAGDDLVAGVLGVAALAGLPCVAPPLAGRTTLLGATQIAHAAAGALIEPLHRVVAALLAGHAPPAAARKQLLALGHSSGADMLAGAHLALAALSGRLPGR